MDDLPFSPVFGLLGFSYSRLVTAQLRGAFLAQRWGGESCEFAFGGLSPAGAVLYGAGSVPMEYVQMVSIVCYHRFTYAGVREDGLDLGASN